MIPQPDQMLDFAHLPDGDDSISFKQQLQLGPKKDMTHIMRVASSKEKRAEGLTGFRKSWDLFELSELSAQG